MFAIFPSDDAHNHHKAKLRKLLAERQPEFVAASFDLPGRTFRGTVARMANALDPSTRTMLVEVDVPNADGALFPGVYATVDLSGSRPDAPLVVPAGAILFRRDGAQVAIVQPDHTLRLQKITVGRDYGDRVEILQGLTEGTTIVAVPGDAVHDGATIVPVSP